MTQGTDDSPEKLNYHQVLMCVRHLNFPTGVSDEQRPKWLSVIKSEIRMKLDKLLKVNSPIRH